MRNTHSHLQKIKFTYYNARSNEKSVSEEGIVCLGWRGEDRASWRKRLTIEQAVC